MSIDVGDEQVVLQRIESEERLGRPFTVHATIISPLEVDLFPHLGKPAALAVLEDGELLRRFHGLVTAGEYQKETPAGHHYRLTIEPWTYYLAQNRQMAIFQDRNAVEIIKEVIEGAGIQDVDYTRLSKPRITRGYTVQYRESDFAFVSRLMEEEGIYYFFRHDADRHVMVLCEGAGSHQPGSPSSLRFNANALSVFTANSKSRFDQHRDILQTWVERVASTGQARVTVRDFDFESPDQPLASESTGEGGHPRDDREIFIYPGRHVREKTGRGDQEQVGRERGQTLLDAQRARRRTFTGTSQASGIVTGQRLDVVDHPAVRLNGSFTVISAVHSIAAEAYRSGEQDDEEPYNVRFEAIPADTNYQSPPETPRPVVQGLETATVTGPAGETIFTDEYGRVKVRFPWDRADTPGERSTCWIRVSQTGGLGNVILPRVGHEVLIDFLHGDPDRPMVMGRVFNKANMPVYDLPANKTRAVWRTLTYGDSGTYPETEALDSGQDRTSNEIRFEDRGGAEELFIHAERDMNSRVRFDESRHVGHNQNRRVGLDRTTRVGRNDSKLIVGKRSTHVQQTDSLLVDDTLSIESKTAVTIRVKNSKITIGPDRITIQSPTVEIQANETAVVNGGKTTRVNGGSTLVLNGGLTDINPDGVSANSFGAPADLGPAAGEGGA
ncbi:type VI secretion system tip protein VgrG [Sphingomonas sp. NBWT7]|uniref:type VI secretion system Vgr family protein n=1 Tax=Sphingomonas sp. NBWT7 TaxID=2596913 RepID=UPI00162A037A|nr:type VI secretion system tip protein TssI/VgrG [Sphingomonas sp. NBWT7]QNE32487.1 type VI secretion system tip protein VgrG [Sphingomonas sp. NBWT7]